MISTVANDPDGPGGPCTLDMSVMDLAVFMRVHRAGVVGSAGDVSATISRWFQCDVDPSAVETRMRGMVGKGWLARGNRGFRATLDGRRRGRLHLRGLVRMMDQGTKMLDVAVVMSVLKLAMIELDGDHVEEDDDDA